MAKVLILAGTAEGRALANALAADHDVTASLAGRTRAPNLPTCRVRSGGFGGSDGLAAYIKDHHIDAVIDATHPFAVTISAHARTACDTTNTPRLRLDRPAWYIPPGTDVVWADTLADAASQLPTIAKRALLTVGADSLDAFRDVTGVWMAARYLEAPDLPGPFTVIVGRPPFTEDTEMTLLRHHAIDCVVAKDAGGDATVSKITAAARLGLRLLLIKRPDPEPGPSVTSAEGALAWLSSL